MKNIIKSSIFILAFSVTGCKEEPIATVAIRQLSIGTDVTLVANQKISLSPVASPAGTNVPYMLRYESEDEAVATVDTNGLITAVALGNTRIRAKVYEHGFYQNIASSIAVKVTSHTLSFSKNIIKLPIGTTTIPKETVLPAGAPYTLVWSVADNNIATVSENGTITAKQEGQTTVSVYIKEAPNTKATFIVYVGVGDINPGSDIIDIGNGDTW